MVERLGRDHVHGRETYVLDLSTAETLPGQMQLVSPRFVCLLAWDAKDAAQDVVAAFARWLLDAGAVWICCWGSDCERVHDVIDEEFRRWPSRMPGPGVVMTTWHVDDSLDEVIEFTLLGTCPDEYYEDGCGSLVGVTIGHSDWAAVMRAALRNSHEFLQRVSAEADGKDAV